METKAERFHIHNFYLLISGKRQTREGCLTDGNDQGIDFHLSLFPQDFGLSCISYITAFSANLDYSIILTYPD